MMMTMIQIRWFCLFFTCLAVFSLTEAAVVLGLEYSIENVHLYTPWFFPVFAPIFDYRAF